MFKKVDSKQSFPQMEEEILKFWEENKIFEKSVEKKAPKGDYVFYDGPPFATGTPHYGHIVASTMKDVVPRYWTMKGYKVERKWGWDCHGLPIENIAEKELGITRKKEIEEMGVDKFNEACRSKVLGYVAEWKKVINRLGRWADMENSYKTMDLPFMESVWWVFKELWDKGLIYEGYRSMYICTRCETTLSQSEVAEGYRDIKDLSVMVKFELIDEPRTFVLAWTTTPWTLIGNVALAINNKIIYCKVQSEVQNNEIYIVAKERIGDTFKDQEVEILEEFEGKDLIGKKYKPLFDYYQNKGLQHEENGWKIYAGDFVTTKEGTGVVHIAPAFGEDDLNLSYKYKLPFIQHVGMDGLIKEEARDFAGLSVKPIEDHQKTDIEVLKYLAEHKMLFAKEKYEHSYPHCWRCDTPLINYATSSWFVSITKIKEKMLKLAQDINWSPKHIKEGRFGNWLEGAKDWSISRQRFWASVIPIWKCEKCSEIKVVGSIDEIKEQFGNPNKLFLVRHGEAENNVKDILDTDISQNHYHLTNKGRKQVEILAASLKKEKIDAIVSSPFLRTKETAEIIAKALGLEVVFDDRIKEFGVGDFNGKTLTEFDAVFPNWPEKSRIKRAGYGIETEDEVRDRLSSFLSEINEKYKNKNIIIVSHGDPIQFFYNIVQGEDRIKMYNDWYPQKGSVKMVYSKLVDLHKHVIDKVIIPCVKCEGTMKRISDVLDTWFDSGSMPYAELHYPFENKEKFESGFPAEFIAEGVDQTRAWFYYLHVIAAAIKDSRAFNNVIVNGIVVGEDGKKLSKRLKNYPDPVEIFNKYGADTLRYYLTSSPVMAAENLSLKESDVADIVRGMMRMLWNSYSFFVLYANIDKFDSKNYKLKTTNLLDRWLISELNSLIKDVNESMGNYQLNRAARYFPKFIDNLSNWYIRRSRKRFWKSENDVDKKEAYQALHYVLVELSKLMAPFTPFIAEEIYKNLTDEESVHLADYPVVDKKLIDEKLNKNMNDLREIITLGLQERAKNKIKVRQPLKEVLLGSKYTNVFDETINKPEWSSILIEELNVHGARLDPKIEFIAINPEITEKLKLEGQAREIIRFIQEMRKEAGYEVDNRIKVWYSGLFEVFEAFGDIIKKEVLADELRGEKTNDFDLERKFKIDAEELEIYIKK